MSDDVEKIIAGVTEGTLNWTAEQIKGFAKKLENHKIAFIEDERTIDLVKGVKNRSEWKIFHRYIKDKSLRSLVQMGIALRNLESDPERLQNLRLKIKNKYKSRGLHIAQFVQNRILTTYLPILLESDAGEKEVSIALNELLNDVDNVCTFVQGASKVERVTEKLKVKILANTPSVLILFASGTAIKKLDKIVKALNDDLDGYELRSYEERNRTKKKTVFVLRNDE